MANIHVLNAIDTSLHDHCSMLCRRMCIIADMDKSESRRQEAIIIDEDVSDLWPPSLEVGLQQYEPMEDRAGDREEEEE